MYEEQLGTDWTDITEAEAIDRAFALGVAAAFGYENHREFRRLRGVLDSAYDRSIVDLAYREGRQKADALRGASSDDGAVWSRLVEGDTGDEGDPSSGGSDGVGPAADRPSLFERAGLLDGGSDLGALALPDFLDGHGPGGEK